MELLILSKLKWDLSAITPYDFLEYLLKLLTDGGFCDRASMTADDRTTSGYLEDTQTDHLASLDTSLLKKNTENFIVLCATEFRFSMYPPSMLSSAALAAAASRLEEQQLDNNTTIEQLDNRPSTRNRLLKQLQSITGVELECLMSCVQQIEETSRAAVNNLQNNSIQQQRSNNATSVKENSNHNEENGAVAGTDNKDGSSDSGAERGASNKTPTEVFNVDWLCVA